MKRKNVSKDTVTTILASVRMTLPAGANVKDALDYVRRAVQNECGGMDSTLPMFHLDQKSVRVALLEKHEMSAYKPGRPSAKAKKSKRKEVRG